MAYIYCDSCGIGFHSNVHSCPECGRTASRAYEPHGDRQHHGWRWHTRSALPREDVESEVRETIYGWRSGAVERHEEATPAASAGGSVGEPVSEPV
jgi:hypothetical protein